MEYSKKYTLNGKLTSENIEQIQENIQEALKSSDKLEICLSDVQKDDIAGFNALISAHMLAKRGSKDLNHINCQSIMLQHMLSQSNFYHVLIDHKKK